MDANSRAAAPGVYPSAGAAFRGLALGALAGAYCWYGLIRLVLLFCGY